MNALFLSLTLSYLILVKADNRFKFKDCSIGKGIVTVNRFSLYPNPISLSKNISASVHVTLHDDIPLNTFVKRNVYKIKSFFGKSLRIPVPCIANVGSCSTEGCKYLKGLKTQVCPFFPPDLKCDCPLKAGTYSGNNVTIPMPKLGSITKFLASGQFRLEWKLMQKDDWVEKELACFVLTGTLKP